MEKTFPFAEGFVETEQGSPSQGNRKCLNCEAVLTGAYCANCGQKDIPVRQTLGDLFMNFISSFWSFESKFIQTGKYLLFKPGILPNDYNTGKRERYFHPARMYVFISFVYFLLIAVLPDGDTNADAQMKTGQTNGFKIDAVADEYKTFAQYDSVQQTLPAEDRDGFIERLFMKRIMDTKEKYKGHDQDYVKDFADDFFANTPRVFFLLLPVFALILKLLYIKRDYFYSEHLIFTVYYYNFFFLAGSIYLLIEQIPFVDYVAWIIPVWIAFYMLLAMKRMYRQSWRKTILKYCLFAFTFGICISIGLVGNALFTFFML